MHPKHTLMLDTWTGKLLCFACNDLGATKQNSKEGEVDCKIEKLRIECLDIVRESKAYVLEMENHKLIAAKTPGLEASDQRQEKNDPECERSMSRTIESKARVHSRSNSSTCSSNYSVQSDASSSGSMRAPVRHDSVLSSEKKDQLDRSNAQGISQDEEKTSWIRKTRGDYGNLDDDHVASDSLIKDLATWTLVETPQSPDSTQESGQASEGSDSSKEDMSRIPAKKQIESPSDSAANEAYAYDNEKSRILKNVFGFTNLGNTCYFNSAMQAILTVIHFEPQSLSLEQLMDRKNYGTAPLSCIFAKLCHSIRSKQIEKEKAASECANTPNLQEIKSAKTKVRKHSARKETPALDPKSKKSSKKRLTPYLVLSLSPVLKTMRAKFAQFRGHAQQDAHELLISFLYGIDDEFRDLRRSSMSETSNPTDSESGLDDQDEKPEQKDEPDSPISPPALNQIFVKLDDGKTYSFQVPPNTSVGDLQSIVARKLKLTGDDFYLQLNRQNSSIEQISSPSKTSQMQSDLSKLSKKQNNFIQALFGCEMMTVVHCKNCAHSSRTSEACFQLSLPIPSHSKHRGAPPSVPLSDCLSALIAPTELSSDCGNGYQCDKCSSPSKSSMFSPQKINLRDATMQSLISRAPQILILHFKRLNRTRKINEHISFGEIMDFGLYTQTEEHGNCTAQNSNQKVMYELISVIVHSGNRGSGHYTCFVSRDNDQSSGRHWFYTSDTNIRQVSIEEVLRCQAYILFYRRISQGL
uniref:Ubiquitin carboxyl-terminal hydrolase n=1 Tax=Albugo laibachii Nc14 TaxID=890382 RepID=F0WTM6_9STRA|nr:ubiquitinspecific protease putative [Albugo laibachii Nc14]|eukprot:CCA24718.1 ubiquitinspecific protease putative [Albugo laibachii Nc14]